MALLALCLWTKTVLGMFDRSHSTSVLQGVHRWNANIVLKLLLRLHPADTGCQHQHRQDRSLPETWIGCSLHCFGLGLGFQFRIGTVPKPTARPSSSISN